MCWLNVINYLDATDVQIVWTTTWNILLVATFCIKAASSYSIGTPTLLMMCFCLKHIDFKISTALQSGGEKRCAHLGIKPRTCGTP